MLVQYFIRGPGSGWKLDKQCRPVYKDDLICHLPSATETNGIWTFDVSCLKLHVPLLEHYKSPLYAPSRDLQDTEFGSQWILGKRIFGCNVGIYVW